MPGKDRKMNNQILEQILAVYIRERSGNLTRHTIKGMAKAVHIEHHNIGPITGTERLTGWPEADVEWHGSTGYGSKG